MSENLTDEQLVKKSLENLDFFANIVERYEKKLKFYILRISHFSDLEAEEILQEIFLKTWKNLNDFDSKLKFSSWIYRITHNEVISNFRKYKSRGEDKREILEPEIFENIAGFEDFTTNFDTEKKLKEIQEILEILSPAEYREVLILKYFEDKSYDEISDILQKPNNTIATLLSRAKKKFKILLEK